MKVLLDACLVLTKQDRLCHVVMATSSSHYFTWLRQLNVLQHARVLSIGDCTREEAHRFFTERLLPQLCMARHGAALTGTDRCTCRTSSTLTRRSTCSAASWRNGRTLRSTSRTRMER